MPSLKSLELIHCCIGFAADTLLYAVTLTFTFGREHLHFAVYAL